MRPHIDIAGPDDDVGPDSLLRNGWSMCFGSPTVKGTFAAHSGRTAAATAPVALTGCR